MVKVEPIRVCQKQENLNATLTLFYNQVGFFIFVLNKSIITYFSTLNVKCNE